MHILHFVSLISKRKNKRQGFRCNLQKQQMIDVLGYKTRSLTKFYLKKKKREGDRKKSASKE